MHNSFSTVTCINVRTSPKHFLTFSFDHFAILFGQHLQFNLNQGVKILLVTSWTEIKTPQPLFQNTCLLGRPRVANFADISKIATIFIKATLKKLIKV